MKKIASVIVDLPTLQTDKPYDYLIPQDLIEHIEEGMRVIVPFGNRRIQGFVVKIKEQSNVNKLKEIIEPMDVQPVLNKELLNLGDYLANKTLCYKISAFQVMLPPALKAKYEKYIEIGKGAETQELPNKLLQLFEKNEVVSWREAEKVVT